VSLKLEELDDPRKESAGALVSPLAKGFGSWLAAGRQTRLVWLLGALGALLGLVGGGGAFFYAFDQAFGQRCYPNLTIRGVAVGRMTPAQAKAAVLEHYAPFLQHPLTLTYQAQTWNPTLQDLGVKVEVEAAVAEAFALGRSPGFGQLFEFLALWQHGAEVPLQLTVNQAVMQTYLLARAKELNQLPINAQLVLQGLETTSSPGFPGKAVAVPETLQELTAALQTLKPQKVALRTHEILPFLSDAAVKEAQEKVQTLLQSPLIIKVAAQTWQWSPQDLAQMVQILQQPKANAPNDQLQVTLNHHLVQKRLQKIKDSTGNGGLNPRVEWNGGELKITRAGEPGQRIDEKQAEQLILAAITSTNRVLELPLKTVEPKVTPENLAKLGIKELIAEGKSDFTGSAAYRITNIKAGMKLLHGLLIEPGEEFSFNKYIGSISEANGFVEGYAIVRNRTQLEWGGGICQDSTTLFRAVFWAGLPITERWGHSFYINWYDKYGYGQRSGPGMDATIFTGGPDFKFVNDTGHWLLLQTSVDPEKRLAEVFLYGTKKQRVVEVEGPVISNRKPAPEAPVFVANPDIPRGTRHQSDKARDGMEIHFTRIIKENGGEVRRENFLTRFKPWPNIYELNPLDLVTPVPTRVPLPPKPALPRWQPTAKPVLPGSGPSLLAPILKTVNPVGPKPAQPMPVGPKPAQPAPVVPTPVPPPAPAPVVVLPTKVPIAPKPVAPIYVAPKPTKIPSKIGAPPPPPK